MVLRTAGFVPESITDGPGIRFVVFCQGCVHHCPGCHNAQTWPFEGGEPWEVQQIFEKLRRDPLVRGVTFSGGEPFCQAAAFAELAQILKQHRYEVAAYSGWTFEELCEKAKTEPETAALLGLLDVLVDGRFEKEQLSLELKFRGSRNQRILDVPASLAAGRAIPKEDGRWK
ncbi:MAG: anaerobic ribonucleoside-triphosphate reductase activating protein [Oscillospiraceae bacterium]|nr:anaerobic ribonucleoside-triphosphate reductase activating protein [Oscillospiraceae bacterium]